MLNPNENHLPLRYYTGDSLLKINEDKSEALIEDVLFENDYVMIVAPPKMGKTILTLQMACSLSSGTPFLDTFHTKPSMVWYFATEGKDEDIKDRLIRISKVTPLNQDNFMLICSNSFRFNTTEGKVYLDHLIGKFKDKLPKVIFIDALYRAIKGSLKDDEAVNEFHYVVGNFAERCGAATILVHHLNKPFRMQDGQILEQTGEDAYGSRFLIASVDHCFSLEKWKKDRSGDKFLRCSSQRSGKIIDDIRLNLTQPDPLGFNIISNHLAEKARIVKLLETQEKPVTLDDIIFKTKITRTLVYAALKELLDEKKITKEGKKTKVFMLTPDIQEVKGGGE